MKLHPKRLRRWWYRRQLVALGHDPEHARLIATVLDGLDVHPSIIGGPAGNHWASWAADPNRCPLGPPPPCPDVEEYKICGTYEFIGWDNDVRIAAGLPPRGVDEPPADLGSHYADVQFAARPPLSEADELAVRRLLDDDE
jgi:hypothetical protein